MKDINNIDKLLKEQMQDFTPDVPAEVWTQISSNLSTGAAPASVNPVSGFTFGLKSAIIAGITVIAGASYLLIGGNEKSTKLENTSRPQSVELSKSEIVQNNPISDKQSENTKTPLVKFKKPTPISNTEVKSEVSITTENPSVPAENLKSENFVNPELNPSKYESLIYKDTKTEIVEGNPESENSEEINKEEIKSHEPENKKEYPIVNNAFSPDGDGLNDELVIEMPPVDFYHLRIFTKKGVLVFETENIQTKWKGLVLGSGIQAEPGEYRYIIEYQPKGKENVKVIGGYIFLNR